MKNSTILKDELSLLRADKSSVLTELRNKSKELKSVADEIAKLETKKEKVRTELAEESARLQDIQGRAVSLKKEVTEETQHLKNLLTSYESLKTSNSKEVRLHLGRIKELKEEIGEIQTKIFELKKVFDNNSKVYLDSESNKRSLIRTLDADIKTKEEQLQKIDRELLNKEAEEKKLTKERLKREDKIRTRERSLDSRELSLIKREEDLITMSRDISIVYNRLKELYAETNPTIDLDKLIFKGI